MKKFFLWTGLILLSPILLFIILTVLLYLPPVQNWAVDKVAEIASEKTGMQISVDRISLVFPLDLGIDGVLVVRPERDTIANIEHVAVDVELMSLTKGQVVVDQLSITNFKINTYDFLSDIHIRGGVGSLSARSRSIDLSEGTIDVDNLHLADADLTILLSDTAVVDTATSETPWLIRVDSLSVLRSQVELHTPGDSIHVSAYLGQAGASEGVFDLLHSIFSVRSFSWYDGILSYDQTFEPRKAEGLDYNHITLSQIGIGLDSIYFSSPNLALKIRQATMKEQSGLAITRLSGSVLLDSASLQLPQLVLSTPYSMVKTQASIDFSVMDSINPGRLHASLQTQIGKQDLMLFLTDMPERFTRKWPEWPLSISGRIDGNMQQADIDKLDVTLPTAFHFFADGRIGNLTDTDHLMAQMNVQAETYDLDFVTALLDAKTINSIRIPTGIRASGNISSQNGRHTANLTATQGKGKVLVKGFFDQRSQSYNADISVQQLNLQAFMPKDSLGRVTASVKASGRGTDPFRSNTRIQANAYIQHLEYGSLDIDSIRLSALLSNGQLQADLSACNQIIEGLACLNAQISKQAIGGQADLDLQKIAMYPLGLSDKPLSAGGSGRIHIGSDLKQEHWTRVFLTDLFIRDEKKTFHPEDFGMYLRTQPDSTWARIQSGNLIVKIDASGYYEQLLDQFAILADTALVQFENKVINQQALKRLLPNAKIHITSGRDNPIATILRTGSDIDFKDLQFDLTASPLSGINGQARMLSLNAVSVRIDSLFMTLKESDHGLTFQGRVANNRKNPQFVFKTLIDGNLHEHGANMGIRFYDDNGNLGLRLGARADMVDEGISLHLLPERPTIGYKQFTLNKDNFLLIGKDNRLQAKIDLIADDGTGVKIYSEDQDSTMLQDITVSLHRFDLEKTTSVLPYVLPRINGSLNGDFHLLMNHQGQISIVSDMQIDSLSYEQNPIGNLNLELVYLQREDDTHAVEGIIYIDEKEIGSLKGEYRNQDKGYLDADLVLEQMPLTVVNGFVPDKLIGLEGFTDGELKVKGPLSSPQVDGELFLSSAALLSVPYGIRLRFDDDPVRIVNSQLLLENFTMYAYNDEPLNIMGNIDFHDTDCITMDVRMRAKNYQLINSKQTKESVAYGKAFINFFGRMNGRLDQLKMRGKLDVLGTTDLTYLLLDSPLSTDNQMNELVKFTDFTDSTQTVVQRPAPQGLDISLNMSIDPGAHVLCGLNVDKTNYADLFGGGDLTMKYSEEGINLTGRYTLSSGQMKYSLPVIPLKTFTIQDGSYVEFTGDPTNPRMNITATERTKASVAEEGQASRSVAFDCGVVITKTLKDMGLQFIIKAPEDMTVQNELNSMTAEQQGKLAVTMLTTGMYLADGNTSGFSMNSALSSFLQSEINNITGNALKTLDLSIGLDNTTDASGAMHTDYSFKFAKRFWNNRLKVQIGGKLSTGADVQGQKQSFFDNVSMEYRLSPTSNQYVKLFYNQNVYDWLEGYTSEYGGGYIWKRKLDKFWDILKIWSIDKQESQTKPARVPFSQEGKKQNSNSDSITTRKDSIK